MITVSRVVGVSIVKVKVVSLSVAVCGVVDRDRYLQTCSISLLLFHHSTLDRYQVHVLGGGVPLSRLCRKPAIAIFQTCVTGESPVQSGTRQNNFNSRVTEKKLDLSQWRETTSRELERTHGTHTVLNNHGGNNCIDGPQ